MKKHFSEPEVQVPAFFTRSLSDSEKSSFEETYKATAWMLRIMRERLEAYRDTLAKESEALSSHDELLKNSAERKALRVLIDYLPEKK